MRPAEVSLLKGTMTLADEETDEKRGLVQAVRSQWSAGIVKKKEDLERNVLKAMVESYAHLNIGDEDGGGEGGEEDGEMVDGEEGVGGSMSMTRTTTTRVAAETTTTETMQVDGIDGIDWRM